MTDSDLKTIIQEKYGALARQAAAPGTSGGCCTPRHEASSATGCGCGCAGADPITANLYTDQETKDLPTMAVNASLGCGNPTALAELHPGETVLDLGSGGGIDVLLSARRVGPSGKVYGLDMTDDMLALARDNQRKAGVDNVEFLKGDIEQIPLPDASVDVIISNCVINLATDKDRVLTEAFRVLRPGGRFAVSDVVVHGDVPAAIRHDLDSWVGCVAGALADSEYESKLSTAGFVDVAVEPWRAYDGPFASAFIRASKPVA